MNRGKTAVRVDTDEQLQNFVNISKNYSTEMVKWKYRFSHFMYVYMFCRKR